MGLNRENPVLDPLAGQCKVASLLLTKSNNLECQMFGLSSKHFSMDTFGLMDALYHECPTDNTLTTNYA